MGQLESQLVQPPHREMQHLSRGCFREARQGLDQAHDSRRGLAVAHVRLDSLQHKRGSSRRCRRSLSTAATAFLTVHGVDGADLDGVARCVAV